MDISDLEISALKENKQSISCKYAQYSDDSLGPLPLNWEKAETEHGEIYFIDHNTGRSHWLDPRLSKFKKKSLEECKDNELPFGWDVVYDSQYGTYYIDHVNRKTQYENPVIQHKRKKQEKTNISTNSKLGGERIVTKLIKSTQGFGFTMIGGVDINCKFLQIKSILPNGPASIDGNLKSGDILVCVNEVCVLEYSQREMINLFQSIEKEALIEVCRGYPLQVQDPINTEVIKILAISSPYNNFYSNDTEVIKFSVLKSQNGFGFTISDSLNGQKVKKILDYEFCKNIQEGDIILSINGIDVKQMNHNQVVEVLKECPRDTETQIKVLRNKFCKKYRKINNHSKDVCTYDSLRSKSETNRILPLNLSIADAPRVLTTAFSDPCISTANLEPHSSINSDKISTHGLPYLINDYNELGENKQADDRCFAAANSRNAETFDDSLDNIYSMSIINKNKGVYPHINCFCFDCQDFLAPKENSELFTTLPLQMNENIGTRLYQFIHDRKMNNLNTQRILPANQLNLFSKKNKEYIFEVMLEKQQTGFGFRIVGGIEENLPVTVGHIIPKGAADLNGKIKTGDEIISINGISLKNTSHHKVVQLMAEAGFQGQVSLTLKRLLLSYPYDVFITRHENEGFGFVIISSSNQYNGTTIGKLIPGSPAEKSGELQLGDLIIAVNGINICTGLSHEEVVNLIKESGLQVQLTIDNSREERHFDAEFQEQFNNNHLPTIC